MEAKTIKPRVGIVGMVYGGYNLGEEMGPAKLEQMVKRLRKENIDCVVAEKLALNEADARSAGKYLAKQNVDCILVVMATFVPDYFIVELLDACDVPVFLWAVEREMQCLSLVAGPMITATLYNLKKKCALYGADVDHDKTLGELLSFARAAMLVRVLRTSRVGYCGGKCPIMFSMATDEYALKRILGTTVITIPIEEFYAEADNVSGKDAEAMWKDIRKNVGEVTALNDDGVKSSRYYLASKRLVEKHNLGAISLNCFPNLKSQVCLAVAKLNDDGIAAACEGDLHSTILMHLLQKLSDRAAFNGDWLRIYPAKKEVLFSHCGAGAFSLAGKSSEVCLRCSIETKDGLAVCYATTLKGPVTLANLMMGEGDLRLAVLKGQAQKTPLEYEGTPLQVKFDTDVEEILQRIVRCGAGHHWNGAVGDYVKELSLVCSWLGVKYTEVSA